jgi:diketogulonate reductase-like aldo/keto reductase
MHWPEPDEEIEEGWQTLVDLQRDGKVRYIGVSNHSVSQMSGCRRFIRFSHSSRRTA